MKLIKETIKETTKRLNAIKVDPDLARAEKLLKLSMLQAKINVQKSLYGMNLVKTVSLAGAAASAILNMFGIKFTNNPAPQVQEKMAPLAENGLSLTTDAVSLSIGQSVANHAYLIFGAIIVLVLAYEFLNKKNAKENEKDEE